MIVLFAKSVLWLLSLMPAGMPYWLAEKGAGMMIMVASKFQLTDIVIMGIILIGVIGYGIDILMRMAEKILVPWKGRS